MPKLPETKPNEIYTLAKYTTADVVVNLQKPIFGTKGKPNFKRTAFIVFGLVILASTLIVTVKVSTNPKAANQAVSQQAMDFVYPLNVADLKFPSDFLKQQFLANFQKAKNETASENRYPFLEANFKLLLNSYAQTQSYDLHAALDKYKEYIQKNYPDKYSQNKGLYDFPCLDKVCAGNISLPAEIEDIKKSLTDNKAIIPSVRDGALRNVDLAAASKDKNYQGTIYANVLYSLYAEYQRTNDVGIKDVWLKLYDYISKNYSDIKIRDDLKIK